MLDFHQSYKLLRQYNNANETTEYRVSLRFHKGADGLLSICNYWRKRIISSHTDKKMQVSLNVKPIVCNHWQSHTWECYGKFPGGGNISRAKPPPNYSEEACSLFRDIGQLMINRKSEITMPFQVRTNPLILSAIFLFQKQTGRELNWQSYSQGGGKKNGVVPHVCPLSLGVTLIRA